MRQTATAVIIFMLAVSAAGQIVTAPGPRAVAPSGISASAPVVIAADCSEGEPNETFAAASPMTLPANCNGFASATDASSIRIDYGGGLFDGIEDFYQFTLSSSTRVSVTLSWSDTGADFDVFLFPASGPILVGSNVNGSAPESFTSNTLAPGTYYVGVSAFSGGSNYTLNVSPASTSSNCTTNTTTTCLNNGRFRVRATYDTGSQTGNGGAVRLTSDTGYFWFFGNANVEMVVKILDACSFNNRFWVFAGGLTDVGVSLNVTDTQTGQTKTYTNPRGTAFKAIQDTEAFATCGSSPNCTFALGTPSPASFAAGGGSGSVGMTAPSGCSWSATSDQSWLTITGGASGSGNGTINYSVAANSGGARNAVISAGGQTATITQASASACNYGVSPTSASFAASGGTGTVNVTAPAGCAWTASSSFGFITITSGSSGSGNGTVSYSVSANSGSARTGAMTIAGQTVTITQSGAPAPNYDGHWFGATSQQRAFSFDVANNKITKFTLDWHATGGCTVDGSTTVTYNTPQSINGSSFSLSISGPTSITINGTFSSTSAASGNFSVNYTQPFPSCSASGSGTFNVTKQ